MDVAVPLLGRENIGYLLPADQHDSDPKKDWNPLYRLAARQEGRDVFSVNGTYKFKNKSAVI